VLRWVGGSLLPHSKAGTQEKCGLFRQLNSTLFRQLFLGRHLKNKTSKPSATLFAHDLKNPHNAGKIGCVFTC
jgi:hypothetical protein